MNDAEVGMAALLGLVVEVAVVALASAPALGWLWRTRAGLSAPSAHWLRARLPPIRHGCPAAFLSSP